MTVHIPLSPFDDIAWPAPVVGKQATYLGLQCQLEQSQWWSGEELVSAQLNQLSLLLQHAVNTVPYYKKRFKDIPFDFSGKLTLNEWRRLPILTRDDLQKAGNALNSKAVPKRHGDLHNQRSSGSTGKPVAIKQTALSGIYWESFTLREALWHKRDLRSKLAVIRHSRNAAKKTPKGIRGRGWGKPFEELYETGPGVFMHSSIAIPDQAAWLQREDPDYLLAYPSVLHELASYFIDNGLSLSNLKTTRAFGEVLDEKTRQVCRQAWGVPVIDGYSSNEVGNMAFQCPEHEHLHVQSESLLLEVLDKDGNPCRPGETGQVIATPLHNYATPLLRYAVGDYAEVGEACDCGRGLPVLKRVLGRSRNLATRPDGKKFWPGIQLTDLGKFAPVTQAQLIQRSVEHLEARLVVDAAVTGEQEAAMAKLLQELFGFSFQVTFTYLDEIPRSPTDKYEDFFSEV